MTTLKAIVSGNIKGNRLLKKTAGESGIVLSLCSVDETPEFRSTGALVDGQPVSVIIKDAPVWKIEAGGPILSGETVGVGAEGTAVKADEGFGYAANDVKAGELVNVVRTGGSGGAGEKGPTGDKGPKGDVGNKGPIGDQGPIGEKGPNGDKGPTGDKGPDGDPATTE